MQHPVFKKKTAISPIWFLPFIALCIGCWLLYSSYRDAGIDITIHFTTADGITAGKTKVIYKGIPVGTVTKVEVDADLNGVNIQVEMDKRTRNGLVQDTLFWIVRPEISAGRIQGLDTLVSGAYIGVKKGESSQETNVFTGLTQPPPVSTDEPGLHITLKSPSLYSLQRGSHVYMKNLQIGQVEEYKLEPDGMITLQLFIQPKFSHLIRKESRFWNASGLSVTGDLQAGITLNMESLASLIYGGITCATPEVLKDSPPAESGQEFTLYKDFENAEYGIPMTLQLASGEGIIAGKTRVVYRGLKAGVVKQLNINEDNFHTVTATILLDPRAEVILRDNTKFWVIRPEVSLEGIQNIETLVTGPYITFQPGDGPSRDHFVVEANPMPIPTMRSGTYYILEAEDSGSLKRGAPVLYRKLVVGEITDISLNEDGQTVQTKILVYQPYDKLVRKNSVFWNVSGIQVDASLSNFRLNLSSLRTMLTGGITFFNPPGGIKQTQAESAVTANTFPLYDSYHDAVDHEKLMQPNGLTLQVQTANPVNIRIGSPVLYKNIKVGEVMDLNLVHKTHRINIDLLIFKKFRHLVSGATRFYNQSGIRSEISLQGLSLETGPLEAIVNGGISFYTPKHTKKIQKKQKFTLYDNLEQARHADGLHLTLYLHNAKGIGRHTAIRYQGIEIGKIVQLDINQNLEQVVARAVVNQGMQDLFCKDSVLYLVGPQMSLSGISNLETLLTGTYINLKPGQGEPAREFTVLPQAPGRREGYAGLNIILESETRGSLKAGSPIYFRQVPVGLITGYELSPTGQQVWIEANIHPEYQHLVHTGTKFWSASGIEVSGGVFSGMTVQTESVEALLSGGVSLATPEKSEEMGEPAKPGDHFLLEKKAREQWKSWAPELQSEEKNIPARENSDSSMNILPEKTKHAHQSK